MEQTLLLREMDKSQKHSHQTLSHKETENLNRPIAGVETETRIQNFPKKLVGCSLAGVPAFWSPVVSDKQRQSWKPNKRKTEDKMALHIRIYQTFEGELMPTAFELFQILKGNHPKLISWGPIALTPTLKPQKRVSLMNTKRKNPHGPFSKWTPTPHSEDPTPQDGVYPWVAKMGWNRCEISYKQNED